MIEGDDPFEGYSLEQLRDRARAILDEAEYWRHLLEAANTINDGVFAVSQQLTAGMQAALNLFLTLDLGSLAGGVEMIESLTAALAALREVQAGLDGILSMADGRAKQLAPEVASLREAAGLGDDDEGAGPTEVTDPRD